MRSDRLGALLVLLGSAGLLAGAFGFEHVGGLVPCEMCWWQRWALMATAFLAADALVIGAVAGGRLELPARLTALVSVLALLANAGIALFHAGVERKWWQGITRCTAPITGGDARSMMADILAQPIVRCDAIAWEMFGISMAGWNFFISLFLAGVAAWLILKPRA